LRQALPALVPWFDRDPEFQKMYLEFAATIGDKTANAGDLVIDPGVSAETSLRAAASMEGHKDGDEDEEMGDAEASTGTNVQAIHSSIPLSPLLRGISAANRHDGTTKHVAHYLLLKDFVRRIWIKVMRLDHNEPLHDRVAELHERIIDQIACAKTECEQDPTVNPIMRAQMSAVDLIVRRNRTELAEEVNFMLINHQLHGKAQFTEADFRGTTAMRWVFGTAWMLDWKICLFRGGKDGKLKTCARCRSALTRDPDTGAYA
jgi:hypothetical protein